MASAPLDVLDEFLDFSQLENDYGMHGCGEQHEFDIQDFPTQILHHDMDWQPTAPAHGILTALPSDLFSDLLLQSPTDLISHDAHLDPGSTTYVQIQSDVDNNALAAPSDLSDKLVQDPVPSTLPQRNATVIHKPASAKRKGPSSRIPAEARQMLEEEFAANPYPCSWEIDIIAHQANLDVKRVRNWYNNTRARKKNSGENAVTHCEIMTNDKDVAGPELPPPNASTTSLASRLSRDSLEALDKHANEAVQPPQPPLAVYLAQSYQEEALNFSAIQNAIDNESFGEENEFYMDTSSSSKMGRSGSVITSLTSSDGTAPTTYSSGSNMSSFGRNRRRGRRRMEWKTSPYTQSKYNGLNSAGIPQDNLPFFCTFCPRAFKTKYEWVRHEDSVHALRTTWICCDTKHAPLPSCPFCGHSEPDEYHLASHKYQQCRNKPESQRTFYRRDHFIQHLHHVHFANVKHPSARLGCQARLLGSEGQNFGCKDLAIKWRRFGAPIKAADPMLHCGFCGKQSKNWSERCEHVAEHMYAGEMDRSAWWPERLEHHLENLCSPNGVGPFRCRYCQKVFINSDAMNNHSHCRVWSCRFLRSFDDVAAENAGPPLCPQFPSPKAHHCHLCGAGYRAFHVEHAQHYHRYRQCDQHLYTSEEDFLDHLYHHHGALLPSLLKGNSVLEQNFSRNKGASFEPLDFDEILQGCRVGTPRGSFVDPVSVDKPPQSLPVEHSPTSKPQLTAPARKKTQDHPADSSQRAVKTQRQRADSSGSKPTPQGPRFFRLSPLVPFLSSRIYYLRSAMPASLFPDGKAVLEEVPKSHVASLVMSSGLLGMVGVRFPVYMKRDGEKGPVEFALDEDDE
jgi:hypothetical protein